MVKRINIRLKNNSKIYFVGDMHLGSKTFAEKEFETLLNKIKKEPNSKIILMGDMGDWIFEDDTRRYDSACIDKKYNTPEKQYAAILKYFQPLQKKILGIILGNHEKTFSKTHQDKFDEKNRDYAEKLSRDLKVQYLEDMGIIEVKIGFLQKYTIVVAHGVGASSKLAGQINALNNIINSFEIVPDVVCMGHVHSLQTIVNPKMNFKFQTKIKHLGLTGNFYKTYIEGNINYASQSLYNPLPIGCIAYEFDSKGNIKDEKVIL